MKGVLKREGSQSTIKMDKGAQITKSILFLCSKSQSTIKMDKGAHGISNKINQNVEVAIHNKNGKGLLHLL